MKKRNLNIVFFCCVLLAALSASAAAADVTRAEIAKWNLLHITEKYAAPEYLTKLADMLPRTVNVTLSDGQTAEVSVSGEWTPEPLNSRWTNSVNLSALPEGTADPQGILDTLAVTWSVDDYTGAVSVKTSPQFIGQPGAFAMWRYMSGTDIVEFWQIPDGKSAVLRANQNSEGFNAPDNGVQYDISAWTAQDAGEWFGLYYFSSRSYYGMGAYLAGSCTVSPKTYTLTLRPNGGALQSPETYQTVFANGAYHLESVPSAPVRNQYSFDGWFTQATGGEAFSVTTQTAFTADTTLYAHWTREGGSVPSSRTSDGKELQAIEVTGVPGATRSVDTGNYDNRFGWRMSSNLYQTPDGNFVTVDAAGENVVVTFWNQDFRQTGQKTLPAELSMFGGFFHGETYNYIAFGQGNAGEDDTKEVYRVVKYDQNWNRLSAVAVRDCYTYNPFDAGSCRMAESGNLLTVHTSRTRYLTDDGKHHQSQLTIIINTDTMTVENDLGAFQGNHVSHSFNQFVLYDGNEHVLVDHGDAYPRGVVLHKADGESYRSVSLMDIPGPTGDNWTGVSVGGFAQSGEFYLVAANTVRQSAVQYAEDGSFNHTLDSGERDAILLSVSKYMDAGSVRQDFLTDYYQKGLTVSAPYLVPAGENRYVVLWQEFSKVKDQWGNNIYQASGVRYALVNGNADFLTDAVLLPNAQLSRYCQPISDGDNVFWYVDTGEADKRIFYQLSLSGEIEEPQPQKPEIQSLQAADGVITVTLGGELPADALLAVSVCNANGKFVRSDIVKAATGQVSVPLAAESGAIVRAFLLDKSYCPLCASKSETAK